MNDGCQMPLNTTKRFSEEAQYLEALRLALGDLEGSPLDVTEFAERCGITRGAYSHYENGRNQITIDAAKKIALTTGVSIDYLTLGRLTLIPHELARSIEAKLAEIRARQN